MRFYDIAMYVFIFNLMLGFLSTALEASTSASVGGADYMNDEWVVEAESKITSNMNDVYTPVYSELNWLVENVRLGIQAISTFLLWLGKCTILFPVLWYQIGAPYFGGSPVWTAFIVMLSLPLYFIMVSAVVQLTTGKSAKEVQ